ncbi:unnamed protein product, partial [Ectocarpus sp. 13 AM-2016]
TNGGSSGSRGGGGLLWGEERDRDRGRGSASPFSRVGAGGEAPPSLGSRNGMFAAGSGGGADPTGASPFHHHGRGADLRDGAGNPASSSTAASARFPDSGGPSQDSTSPAQGTAGARNTGRSSPAVPPSSGSTFPHQ